MRNYQRAMLTLRQKGAGLERENAALKKENEELKGRNGSNELATNETIKALQQKLVERENAAAALARRNKELSERRSVTARGSSGGKGSMDEYRKSLASLCGGLRANAAKDATLLKRLEALATAPPTPPPAAIPSLSAAGVLVAAPAAASTPVAAPSAPPAPQARKAALLIGINYVGTASALRGCINDVRNVKAALINSYGFLENDILVLTDDQGGDKRPTAANIVKAINWLVSKNREGYDSLWFHYSGHGTYTRDRNRDERDWRDECIVPVDFRLITDDALLKNLVSPLKAGTQFVCFMDCCHSGTQLDLRWRYVSGNRNILENRRSNVRANVILVSGCKDNQTSADVKYSDEWAGAMTRHLLATLKESNYNITCYNLLRKLRDKLRRGRLRQIPQITCSRRLSGVTAFSAKGEPGTTAYISN